MQRWRRASQRLGSLSEIQNAAAKEEEGRCRAWTLTEQRQGGEAGGAGVRGSEQRVTDRNEQQTILSKAGDLASHSSV